MKILYKNNQGNVEPATINQGSGIQVDILPTANSSSLNKIYQYIGATTAEYTHGYFYECKSDGAVPPVYSWEPINVEEDNAEPTQYETMPTAEVDREGEIVQYIGETDADYTNGYFYKCIYQNGAWTWVNVEVQNDSFITKAGRYRTLKTDHTGSDTVYVISRLGTSQDAGLGTYLIRANGGEAYILTIGNNPNDKAKPLNYQILQIAKGNEHIKQFKWNYLGGDTTSGSGLLYFLVSGDTTISLEQIGALNEEAKLFGLAGMSAFPTGEYVIDLTVTTIESQTIQYDTMPTAGTAYVDKIVQYTGTDTGNYKNGYFYKCVADTSTTPVTYTWEQTDVQPNGGSDVAPRQEKQITTQNDFRTTQGSYSFITTTAVTITLADAETITIPANTQGFFDVGETDEDTDDYAGVIQYVVNGREKTVYFNSLTFTLPVTDSVQIDDTTASTTTTYSSSKIETAIGGSKAAQMTGATAYQDGKAGLATKPVAGDNQKALFGDGRYHTIYAANTGSTIIVVTDEPTLYGRPVTLTAGSTTLTGTFSNTGECTFSNLALYGAVQIASEDAEGNPSRGSTNISYFGTYVVGVGFNFATIKFTSSDISLAGIPVAIYLGNTLVTETSLRSTGYGTLEAVCYVEQLGKYKAIAQTAEGAARASVNVTAIRETFTAELVVAEIYGFVLDHSDSNPATCVKAYDLGDYEVLNAGFTPAHMDFSNDRFEWGSWTGTEFFFPKPCMLNYDGTVAYYLDPNDYSKKADGTASDVADMSYNGNVMVEFPTIYFKRWQSDDYSYVIISNKQLDADFHAWAHHDVNGNVLPYIYLAAYNGSYDGTRMRSMSGCGYNASLLSGSIMCQTTMSQEISFSQANNNTGYIGEGWYIKHKADWDMVNDLLLLIGMNTNTQTTFGRGNDSRGRNGVIGSGTMDDKGLFWGSNNGTSGVKVFGIENWWANMWVSVAGWIDYYGTQKVKMTYGQEDGSTVDGYNLDGAGYVAISNSTPTGTNESYASAYITSEYGLMPTNGDGSSSTWLTDGIFFNNSISTPVYIGASPIHQGLCGTYAIAYVEGAEFADWHKGASLTYKGVVA